MVNYREILRLNRLNYSQHQIAASVHSSRNTIREVLQRAASSGLTWPLDDSATNETMKRTRLPLHPQRTGETGRGSLQDAGRITPLFAFD